MRACYPYLAGLNTRPSLACLPAVQGATSLPIGLFPSGNQRCAMVLVPASLCTAGQLLPKSFGQSIGQASCQAFQSAPSGLFHRTDRLGRVLAVIRQIADGDVGAFAGVCDCDGLADSAVSPVISAALPCKRPEPRYEYSPWSRNGWQIGGHCMVSMSGSATKGTALQ